MKHTAAVVVYFLLAVIVALALTVGAAFVHAWAIVTIWPWFLSDLPWAPTFWQALGLTCVIAIITDQYNGSSVKLEGLDAAKEAGKRLLFIYTMPLSYVLIAWIIQAIWL